MIIELESSYFYVGIYDILFQPKNYSKICQILNIGKQN